MTRFTTKAAMASLLVVAAGAAAETDLSLARSYDLAHSAAEYDSLVSQSNLGDVKVGVQVQARYMYNSVDDNGIGDNDTTIGFSLRRTKVGIEGKVADNMKGKVKFAFDRADGSANLEDAYLKWAINDDLTLKVGQFKQGLIREENVSSSKQLASERSVVNESLNQGFSQGIQAHFGGDAWRGLVGFTDGLNSGNSAFNSTAEADYALNARFEFLFGDAEWSQFKQFTSWRGATQGSMLGAAIAFQSMGDTNFTTGTETEMTTATIDYSFVGDGWNFYAAGIWQNMDISGGAETDEYGFLVQGGVFVSDHDELFARWDMFTPDEDATNDDDFNTLTFGWNHYFTPESHAAKLTIDCNYYLDESNLSDGVSTSSTGGHGLMSSNEDGQFTITAQMQFLF